MTLHSSPGAWREGQSCKSGFDPAEAEKAVRAKVHRFPSVVLTSQALHSDTDTTRSNADVEHVMESIP